MRASCPSGRTWFQPMAPADKRGQKKEQLFKTTLGSGSWRRLQTRGGLSGRQSKAQNSRLNWSDARGTAVPPAPFWGGQPLTAASRLMQALGWQPCDSPPQTLTQLLPLSLFFFQAAAAELFLTYFFPSPPFNLTYIRSAAAGASAGLPDRCTPLRAAPRGRFPRAPRGNNPPHTLLNYQQGAEHPKKRQPAHPPPRTKAPSGGEITP